MRRRIYQLLVVDKVQFWANLVFSQTSARRFFFKLFSVCLATTDCNDCYIGFENVNLHIVFFSLCSATTGSSEHLSTTSSLLDFETCYFACAKINLKVHPLSTAKYVEKHMSLWPQIIRLVGLLSFFVIHTDLWFLHFSPENFGFAQFFFEKFMTRYQWPRGIQKQNLAFTSQNTPMWTYKHTLSQWASLLHEIFQFKNRVLKCILINY